MGGHLLLPATRFAWLFGAGGGSSLIGAGSPAERRATVASLCVGDPAGSGTREADIAKRQLESCGLHNRSKLLVRCLSPTL